MKYILLILLVSTPSACIACLKDCVPDDAAYNIARIYEGLRLFTYKDVAGHETVGFGHLVKPGESFQQPITSAEAEKLLEADEAVAAKGVNEYVNVDLKSNQFDSLTDFSFNLGVGTLEHSTLISKVNSSLNSEIPAQFMRYDKARVDGMLEVVKGLFNRRKAEASLYME